MQYCIILPLAKSGIGVTINRKPGIEKFNNNFCHLSHRLHRINLNYQCLLD